MGYISKPITVKSLVIKEVIMPKRGENIYKRKDGRWEGRYRSGYRADGKTKYRSIYGRSYQEVRAKLLPLKTAPVTVASFLR